MSKEQDALKLALEALEESHPEAYRHIITAIREALSDNALDRMAENARELGLDYEPPCKTGSQCTSKCQQCEQPAQQPNCNDCGGFDPECPLAQPVQGCEFCSHPLYAGTKCKNCGREHPAQQQEPVAWRYNGNLHEFDPSDWATGPVTPLYTSPQPSKPWVGLTPEDHQAAWDAMSDYEDYDTYGAVLEAKLREKNA